MALGELLSASIALSSVALIAGGGEIGDIRRTPAAMRFDVIYDSTQSDPARAHLICASCDCSRPAARQFLLVLQTRQGTSTSEQILPDIHTSGKAIGRVGNLYLDFTCGVPRMQTTLNLVSARRFDAQGQGGDRGTMRT